MKTKAFFAGLCVFLLTSCGPIIGGMMVAGTGVKEVTVVQGDLADLQPGSKIAVLGPFDKTPEAFYICRGEEAASFTNVFNQVGLFQAELSLDNRFPERLPKASDWQGKDAAEVQAKLGLDQRPDLIMSGTILQRQMVAAPTQGVIMDVAYRLDFLDLSNGQITTVEFVVKELFQEAIPETVNDLAKRIKAK